MSTTDFPNPFLFACGVPRSGTTLLQRMLNSHPQLAVANDSHFIPRALELTNPSLLELGCSGWPIPLTTELAENVFHYHRFRRLEITRQEFDAIESESENYQQLVAKLYDLYARKSNKQLAGEKTPDYLRRLSVLHALFPSAKLIHLVRDGRDVALSLLQWGKPTKGPARSPLWIEHPVAVCALWWSWLVMASRQQSAAIDHETYLEIRYDALIAESAGTLHCICDFIGLDYSDQMLAYHEGKSKKSGELSAKSVWLPPQRGLRNWRTEMAADQIELFEAIASEALIEFGFEIQTSTFSNRSLETARKCQTWWDQNFLRKHQRVDSRPTGGGRSKPDSVRTSRTAARVRT